jgi:hypothetical protein
MWTNITLIALSFKHLAGGLARRVGSATCGTSAAGKPAG